MAKTAGDKLSADIQKILAEYGETLDKDLDAVTKKIAQKGAKTLKAVSRSTFGGTGKYAGGWTSQTEKRPLHASAVIYNAAAPGLAHLLENGHASPNGGRVPGRAHIKSVEEQLVKEYEEEVLNAIKGD